MAEDSNYEVPHRRRRQQKTDYKNRLKLLKSGKPRAVVRLSNQHTRVQIADYKQDGDENKAQTLSKELREHGWEHNTGNIPAAYLTGYLAGHKTDNKEALLDSGLRSINEEGRVYAAIKGLKDAGIEVPAGEEVLPSDERVKGEHIKEMTDKNIPEEVEKVKENIQGEYN